MPAIAKILIVFASMLLVARVRVPLGLALVGGGLLLSVWAGFGAGEVGAQLLAALAQADLWLLLVITVLIIELGRFMTEPENAELMIATVRRWGGRHGAAFSMMALPAVIGLVPMPGGALFSAPFVKQAGDAIAGRPDWKTAVNYWFRHVWEYWWPLYPGVIVAMSLFEMIDTRHFLAVQMPFTAIAVAAGYGFLVRPHLAELSAAGAAPRRAGERGAVVLFLPLVLVIVSVFVGPWPLKTFFPGLELQIVKLLSVLIGLVLAMAVVLVSAAGRGAGAGFGRRMREAFNRKAVGVLVTLVGVLVFKAMLQSSGLLPEAVEELSAAGIPPVLVVMTLPFLAGLVTGIAVGFTGASFPLVVGLLTTAGSGLTPFATLVLAFGFGYMGMMVSPVHLCFLVTKEYFSAGFLPVYRLLLPCVLSILAFCLASHAILSALGL
jgi:uncharacterized protein